MKNIYRKVLFAVCLITASINISFADYRYFTGFENGTTEEFQNTGGSGSVQSSTKKDGTYALRSNTTGAGNFDIVFGGITAEGAVTNNFNLSTVYVQHDFYLDNLPASGSEVVFDTLNTGGGIKIRYRIDSTGHLSSYNNTSGTDLFIATGATALSTGTWYTICQQAGNGTTAYELKINGVSELSGTVNQLPGNVGFLRLGKSANTNSNSMSMYYDNVVISDTGCPYTAGGAVTKIKSLAPNGASAVSNASQWTGGTNSSNYLEVDEVPSDSDTTYIASANAGDKHYVELQDTGTAGITGTILSVIAYSRRKEASSVTSSGKVRLYSGGTTSDSNAENIGTSYTQRIKIFNTDPNTSTAWSTGGVDAMQVGVVEDNAVAIRATVLNAQVLYEVPVATPTPTATATATATNTPTATPTATATSTPITLKCQMLTGVGG